MLDAAITLIRRQGFNATTVDELCAKAQVTKGAFFHHFSSKDELGAEAARYWTEVTAPVFANADYHALDHALDRLLGYLDFRQARFRARTPDFTCLAGTMAQETYLTHKPIQQACGASIRQHAQTLVQDIEQAMIDSGRSYNYPASELAMHVQAQLQGAFVIAKATGDRQLAASSIEHLKRYLISELTESA